MQEIIFLRGRDITALLGLQTEPCRLAFGGLFQ